MILNPEVQKNVQTEIDSMIGPSRMPSMADRSKMPYTEAVINEIFRITYFLPFGLPHCATEDVQFDGYTIPKGKFDTSRMTEVCLVSVRFMPGVG